MKDIIVEFTEYGAVVHKDAAIIASLKDVPHCFFNPDLSKVSGVSPSFWALNEVGEIVKASPEEIQRRNDYLTSKPAANPSLKTTLDTLKQEVFDEMEMRQEEVNASISDLKSVDEQIINTLAVKLIEVKHMLDKDEKHLLVLKDLFAQHFDKQEKQIKYLKIALALSVLLTTILKVI